MGTAMLTCSACAQLFPPATNPAPTAAGLPPAPKAEPSKKEATQPATATAEPQPPTPVPPSKLLAPGARSEAVLALEKRLAELRYDVGAVDGQYDRQTWQGVVAFQKYANLKRTGTFTKETQEALRMAKLPEGFHPEMGLPRIEIDIPRQVLLYFDGQGLDRVVAVSTGTNRNYCEISSKSGARVCGVARTPRGRFRIQHRIPGWRESDLGKLYNPLYFNGGYAIHGSLSVPAYNASHGCVRISIPSSKWFYETVKTGTPVVVYD